MHIINDDFYLDHVNLEEQMVRRTCIDDAELIYRILPSLVSYYKGLYKREMLT